MCSGFWAFAESTLENISIDAEGFDLEINLLAETIKKGYEIMEVPVNYRKRKGGSSKLKFIDGIFIFLRLIKKRFKK